VLGTDLEPFDLIVPKRMLHKLMYIVDNTTNPLHNIVLRQRCAFSKASLATLKQKVIPASSNHIQLQLIIIVHPSVRCLCHCPLIQGQVVKAVGSGEKPRHPSSQRHSPSPPGGSQDVPRPEGIYNLKREFWVCPRASPRRTCPKNFQREATRTHPNQMPEPPQLSPFDAEEQRLYSEFPPIGLAPHSISKATYLAQLPSEGNPLWWKK